MQQTRLRRVLVVEKETHRTTEGETVKKRARVMAEKCEPLNELIIGDNITLDYRQMPAQQPTSHADLTTRVLCFALERLRKILKNYNERECPTLVTKDFKDLEEPPKEVYSKLLLLLRFYEGDLARKMPQYQKDQAFIYGDRATSCGEEMDYKTFFRRVIETKTKRLSVIGQAGSGKSVMMRRLVRDLAQHNDELLIFFMNFRDFPDSEKMTIHEFLFRGLISDSDANLSLEWILENQNKVIFVLDGLDQAKWAVNEGAKSVGPYSTALVSEIVSNIFKGTLFPNVKVVYSSREHSVASLVGHSRPEMVVALTGLTAADSKWLFKSFIGKDGEKLWKILQMQSYSIIPLLSIPAFLVFTAVVYVKKPNNPPRFMTEVLKNLLEIFMQSGHITEKDLPTVLTGLKKMSFWGLINGKVLFYIIDVQNAGLDFEQIQDWIIKIPGLNQCNHYLLDGKHVLMFSHQIIQEFLAAQYIIEMDIESFRDFVMQRLNEDNWSVVRRFVSGLLLNEEISAYLDTVSDVERKKDLFKNVLKESWKRQRSLVLGHSLELLAALSESNLKDFINDLIDKIRPFNRVSGDSDAYIIASIIRHLSCLRELKLFSCNSRSLQIIWDIIQRSCLRISSLSLYNIDFESEDFTTIGKLVNESRVSKLELVECSVTDEGLKNLLFSCDGVKISCLDISENRIRDTGFETLGKIAKECGVDEFGLRNSGLSDVRLKNFLSENKGSKISKLDVSDNRLDDDSAAVLGDIVKQCSVETLRMVRCKLNDVSLEALLSRARGAKISKLDVSINCLDDDSAAVLGDIVKQCSVETLRMGRCKLNDVSLETLLSRARGAKIWSCHL